MTSEQEKLLTVSEVAVWLRVTENWVRSHANGKRQPCLPSVKLGKNVRFRREDVEAAITRSARVGARKVR
jgi:excisionase family DNA binding protein